VGVDLLPRREIDARARRQAGERAYVVRDADDLLGLQQAVLAECRHLALVRLGVAGAYAEHDRLLDLGELAAPDPIIVVEVRIAPRAAAARAVARAAVLAERRATLRIGEVRKALVALDVGERGRGESVAERGAQCAQVAELGRDRATRGPAAEAAGVGGD